MKKLTIFVLCRATLPLYRISVCSDLARDHIAGRRKTVGPSFSRIHPFAQSAKLRALIAIAD